MYRSSSPTGDQLTCLYHEVSDGNGVRSNGIAHKIDTTFNYDGFAYLRYAITYQGVITNGVGWIPLGIAQLD